MTRTHPKTKLCALAFLFLLAGPASPFLVMILSIITIFFIKPLVSHLGKKISLFRTRRNVEEAV